MLSTGLQQHQQLQIDELVSFACTSPDIGLLQEQACIAAAQIAALGAVRLSSRH